MRYLGSKIKLLSSIEDVIKKNNIQGETFADLFAGTGCVGDYFKDRYKVISNDFLYFSYVLNMAKLKNERTPGFKKIQKKIGCNIFEWLNKMEFTPDESFFLQPLYSNRR